MKNVVPEYHSNNPFVSETFWNRIMIAENYVRNIHPKRLLDAGCGNGEFAERVANFGYADHVVGLDIIKEIESKKSRRVKYIHKNFLAFNDKKFDCIVALDFLEHISLLNHAIDKIDELLKPNCFLITSMPTENIWYKIGRLLTKGKWNSKFDNQDIHYWNYEQLHNKIIGKYMLIDSKNVKFLGIFTLFKVNLYLKR